ncbi:AMP-binding protein [Roseomonas sp. BN140053]|uniref:AMP-binding protein n=1 Tax=Roseomonas sp. BN140053 TaxID=3391898 RepID=UPI0039EB3F1E
MPNADAAARPRFDGPEGIAALERLGQDAVVPVRSTIALLRRSAALWPERDAIVLLPNGRPDDVPQRLPYRELLARVQRCANALRELGVGEADSVGFLLPTLPDTFVTLLGAQLAGRVCPINPLLGAAHIATLLRAVGAKVLVALGPDPALPIWDKVAAIQAELPELRVVQLGGDTQPGALDFDALLAAQPDTPRFAREVAADDIAAFFHTGGTTGAPKLVQHTHGNEVQASWLLGMAHGFAPEDVVLNGFPLFHVAGAFCHGLAELAAGACVLIPSRLGMRNQDFVRNHWRVVEKHRVSILTGGPTFLTTLLNGALAGEDISSARVLITGGSPLPAELAEAFERRFGVPVRALLGMTEACGVVALEPLAAPRVPNSCGWPLPFSAVQVLAALPGGKPDPSRPLPAGETGVLAIRGPQVSPGYTDPRRTAEDYLPGGWLVTGDMGHLGPDGRVFITGRAKDVIIRSGHNIDPAAIEEAILRHPAVELCAAVAQPDPYAGELPVVFAKLRPGAECSAEALLAVAAEHVPERPAVPKRVWLVDRFDMTATGKIQKPELRRLAAEHTLRDALQPLLPEGVTLRVEGLARDGGSTAIRATLSGGDAALVETVRARLAAFRLPFELVAA